MANGRHKHRLAFYGFHTSPGGIGRVMVNLMNGLIEEDVDVDLLLPRTEGPDLPYVRHEVRVIETGNHGLLPGVSFVARYLSREQPKTLLANKERANRVSILAQQITKTRTSIVIRVGTTISSMLMQRPLLKRWLQYHGILYCFRRARGVIAVSRGIARDIEKLTGLPPGQIHVIENPTVSADILDKAREPVNHPWFVPGSPPVILAVGRLVRPKDFPTLLRAFSRVRATGDCRLVICGEGKERLSLDTLAQELGIQEYVDLPGFVDNPFAYMSRAALFVLSSAWEGSPNALIEALAVGLPVVATDCPSGPREILEEGRYGPLVPVGDVNGLANAILETLANPRERAFLQQAAQPFQVATSVRAYLAAMIPGEL